MSLFRPRFALVLLVALFCWGEWTLYAKGREAGRAEVQVRWDREILRIEEAARAQAATQQKAVAQTMALHEQQSARERVIYRDIIKEVPTYVPSDLPVLPGSFRLLHDAAATGSTLPEDRGSGGADAAAVTAEDLAITVTNNYSKCQIDQMRLKALQKLIGLIE